MSCPRKCNHGWVHIQHPTKPKGVCIGSYPCPDCNPQALISHTDEWRFVATITDTMTTPTSTTFDYE